MREDVPRTLREDQTTGRRAGHARTGVSSGDED
jgi:hypothetical protein